MRKVILLLIIFFIPALLSAVILLPMDDPRQSKGISSNSVYDIVSHRDAIWVATGRGVSFKYNNDSKWNIYDAGNGLVSELVSAIYSDDINDILWVSTNHTVEDNDTLFGDGISYTFDEGFMWDTVSPEGSVGALRIIYDITGHDSVIFCVSWLGGLFGSFDGGQNWKSVYYSLSDSLNAGSETYLSNMYFSAVIDTTHNDSLVLWAGSAAGLRRFVYAPNYAKPSSNYIFDITAANSFVFIAGDSGLTRMKSDSVALGVYFPGYRSAYMSDGLPGMSVTTAFGFGDRLFVGTLDSTYRDEADSSLVLGDGSGMAVSDDDGLTFHTNYTGLDDLIGPNRYARQFAVIGDQLFLAGSEAGLFVSSDTGNTWVKLDVDTLDPSPANPRNIVNSLAVDSTNLWVGTDAGLVVIRFDAGGADTLHEYILFEDTPDSGARIYKVAVQNYSDTFGVGVDSTAIWAITHPVDTTVGQYAIYWSNNYGASWVETRPYQSPTEVPYFDIEIVDSIALLVGEDNYYYSYNRISWVPQHGDAIRENIRGRIYTFKDLDLNAILVVNDTLYIGSEHGFAYSPPPQAGGVIWHIIFSNKDPQHFDNAVNYTPPYLTGNFVNVLAVQPLPQGKSRIWASTKPTGGASEFIGVSTSTTDGLNWTYVSTIECWNFDFNGAEVFGASSAGLVYSPDTGLTWDTLEIRGTKLSSDPPVDYRMYADTMTAVRIIGDTLWVGSLGQGIAKIGLDQIGSDNWGIYRVHDPSHVLYAYPTPFSHSDSKYDEINIHYGIPADAYVTLEIYDFAMDLVYTVVDNEFNLGGPRYDYDVKWGGRNVRGDEVAVGIYYIRLSLSTGEIFWGKLAVNP